MKVLLAKSAGFCYGVKRAVELAAKTGEETGGCWMLGDLIHNSHVVEDLARRGVRKTEDPAGLAAGDTVVIRSHGELKSVLDDLEARGVRCVNATCPNVIRIQRLVAQAEAGITAESVSTPNISRERHRRRWLLSYRKSMEQPERALNLTESS